jgi:hypothetical protein
LTAAVIALGPAPGAIRRTIVIAIIAYGADLRTVALFGKRGRFSQLDKSLAGACELAYEQDRLSRSRLRLLSRHFALSYSQYPSRTSPLATPFTVPLVSHSNDAWNMSR